MENSYIDCITFLFHSKSKTQKVFRGTQSGCPVLFKVLSSATWLLGAANCCKISCVQSYGTHQDRERGSQRKEDVGPLSHPSKHSFPSSTAGYLFYSKGSFRQSLSFSRCFRCLQGLSHKEENMCPLLTSLSHDQMASAFVGVCGDNVSTAGRGH